MKYLKILLVSLLALLVVIPLACKKQETGGDNVQTPTQQPQVDPKKVGPPTVVPKDQTPEQYVTEYYEAYKAKNWDKAYEMLPAVNKAKEDKNGFASVRETMPINDFDVSTKSTTKDAAVVEAKYSLQGQGSWTVVWQFKKADQGWIAEGYQAGMSQ